jgi:GNAT superfamily N-acetyltransferase
MAATKPLANLVTRHYDRRQFSAIRPILVEIYIESYARELTNDFFSQRSFERRLDGHVTMPGWECVIGDLYDRPVGYAYGYSAPRGGSSWRGLRTKVADAVIEETGNRTFDLCELMVIPRWRKTGIARAIHDELVAHRQEERASLLVDRQHSRVRALYERWGYRWVGELVPTADAPVFDAMVLPLRQPRAHDGL